MRKLYFVVAVLLGAAAAVVPGLAAGDPPSAASFTAGDNFWAANGQSGSTQVTIVQGGTVSFSYPPGGGTTHNADFRNGPPPTSCTQTAGTNSGSVPPLPNMATGPGWAGSCTFNTPGTYTFFCDHHSFMTGTIVVQAAGTTTGTTTTQTTTTGTTTTTSPTTTTAPTTPTPSPRGSPLAGTAASAISIASSQRGGAVRGAVKISKAGARGRLEVDVFVSGASLRPHGHGRIRVARLVVASLHPGTDRFVVNVNGLARRALHRHKLAAAVLVNVRATSGAQVSATRNVVLRAI